MILDDVKKGITKIDSLLSEFAYDKGGFHMLPLVRLFMLRILDRNESQNRLSRLELPKKGVFLEYLIRIAFGGAQICIKKKSDVVFFSKGPWFYNVKGKYWQNKTTDYLYPLISSHAQILEHSFFFTHKTPRITNDVCLYDFFKLLSRLMSRLYLFFGGGRKEEVKIRMFIGIAKEILGERLDKKSENDLFDILRDGIFQSRFSVFLYSLIFKKIAPRLVFVEEASYGGEVTYITFAAKRLGIPVAELQHGMLSPAHLGYNFDLPKTIEAYYKRMYLPTDLCVWGEYWKNMISYPSNSYILGNPHYESISKQKNNHLNDCLLLPTDAITPALYIDFLKKFLDHPFFSSFSIILKLHPLEKTSHFIEFEDHSRVLLVKEGDIRPLLEKCSICVSSFSTVLFEALSYGKRVFLFDNDETNKHVPLNVAERFKTIDDIAFKLTIEPPSSISDDLLFCPNWEKRFYDYLKMRGIIDINN